MTPTPSPTLPDANPAILFIIPNADSDFVGPDDEDVGNYLLNNGASSWFGFWTSGVPNLSDSTVLNDFKLWMDWPGWSGSPNNSNGALTQTVDPLTFELPSSTPLQVPSGTLIGNTYFIWAVPHNQINGGTQVYSQIGANYLSSTSPLTLRNTSSSLRAVDVVYTGNLWANDTYRIFTNGINSGWNLGSSGLPNSDDYYWGDCTLV